MTTTHKTVTEIHLLSLMLRRFSVARRGRWLAARRKEAGPK
jgi:hypothetical protein